MNKATSVNVSYTPDTQGEMRFTLTWNDERSFIDRIFNRPRPVLSLGVYYVTDFGGRSLIDRLQFCNNGGARDVMTRQGAFNMVPYIWHEGTDRADNGECTESIIVNCAKLLKLKQIAVYAFFIAGKPRWKRANPQLTVEIPGNEPLTFDFNASPKRKRKLYAICDMEINGQEVVIKPLDALFAGHRDCNDQYAWGLNVAP